VLRLKFTKSIGATKNLRCHRSGRKRSREQGSGAAALEQCRSRMREGSNFDPDFDERTNLIGRGLR
jgi:hypothetical protein